MHERYPILYKIVVPEVSLFIASLYCPQNIINRLKKRNFARLLNEDTHFIRAYVVSLCIKRLFRGVNCVLHCTLTYNVSHA